jgi:hypothetical protein
LCFLQGTSLGCLSSYLCVLSSWDYSPLPQYLAFRGDRISLPFTWASLKLQSSWSLPLESWDYRCKLLCQAFNLYIISFFFFVGLEFELRTSCLQSRHSITWVTPSTHSALVILEMESYELAQTGLELWSLSLPSS